MTHAYRISETMALADQELHEQHVADQLERAALRPVGEIAQVAPERSDVLRALAMGLRDKEARR